MSRFQRNLPPGRPNPQAPVRLLAPGLVAPGPNTKNARDMIELLHALGAVGELSEQVRRVQAQDEAVKAEDRGLGARHGREQIELLEADIDAGKIAVPEGAKIDEFAHGLIGEQTRGFSEAYTEGFGTIAPRLIAAFTRKQEQDRKRAGDEQIQLRSEAVFSASDDEIAELIGRTKTDFPDKSESEVLGKLVFPALRQAADAGDREAFARLERSLGDRFPVERAAARAELENAVTRNQQRDRTAFRGEIDTLYNGGVPFDAIEPVIRSAEPRIGPTAVRAELDELDERRRRAARDAQSMEFDAAVRAAEAEYAAANDAAVSAGLGFAIEDRTVTIGDREHRLSNGLDDAMDRALTRIARSNLSDEEKFAAAADLASRNGYMPPVWKKTLDAGFIAATEQSLEPGGKVEQPPPPATVAGFGLFKKLRGAAPGLLESKLPDGPARDFYELAAAIQEDSSVGENDTRALFEARRLLSGPGRFGSLDQQAIASAAHDIGDRFWSADAKNWPEVASQIARRATVYARAGLDPEKAVKRAAEGVARGRINLNGWSVSTADANLPEALQGDFRTVATMILQDWAAKYGKDAGLDADDVTLRVGSATGFWVVADGRTGHWVGGDQAVFSTADLIRLWKEQRDSKRAQTIRETVDRQRSRQELLTRPWQDPFRGLEVGGP